MPNGSRDKPNKAKIARRVIEVLDFFDDDNREASVMDIVRRYGRPQSSTSELLASLVELGLLHKDPYSRTYSLTPRAALLGWSGQTGIVRDGSLVRITDRLVAQTGLPVAVFAMTGLNVQIVSWRTGPRTAPVNTRGLYGGVQVPMSTSAAGWLLLSTVPQPRRDGMVRRLNAEASDERKFAVSEMASRLQGCHERGWVEGPAGCNTNAKLIARLLPVGEGERPLAVGMVHGVEDQVDTEELLASIDEAIRQCLNGGEAPAGIVEMLASAA
ncbi:MAG: helix-turn-helix domain-containing protein [Novosphingobium sp.]